MKMNSKNIRQLAVWAGCLLLACALGACSPAGDTLIGIGGLGDEVTATAEAGEILPTEPTEPPTATPIPAPFGSIIFVSNRDGQMNLYKTAPDAVQQIRLTASGSEDINPVLSPDRTRLAFVSTVNDNTDIYILDLNTLVTTRVTTAPERDSSPSWSPNGQQLVFESFRDGNLEIYITNVDGSNQTRLTSDPAGDSTPVWSPINNEIVFVSNRFGNSDLLLLSPNGQISPLTTTTAADSAPAWSPDGRFVAFKTAVGDLSNLCVIGRDAMNQVCITTIPSEMGTPVWSPNGQWIAIHAKQGEGYGINAFNIVDGSILQLSAPGINVRGTPAWSPDGLRLVFQAQENNSDMELFMVTIPTNEFTRLTTTVAYDGEPLWSDQ